MKQLVVRPSHLKGEIVIPSSKSQTLRALLFGALGKGKSVIHHYLSSTDTQKMIEACSLFGASVDVTPHKIEISGVDGRIKHTENVIDAGNSGIILRFGSAIGALSSYPVVVTGDYSIRHHRPMQPLIDGLSQLGVSISSMRGDGYAPVIIRGPICSGKAEISGEDSQPVSAILIGTAFADDVSELYVQNPGEKYWVGLTLSWFDRLGIGYKNYNYHHYRMNGNARYNGFEYHVPGDMSSAAFPIAAALVTKSELVVKNSNMNDAQGDKELITVFQKMGAQIDIDYDTKSLHVSGGCRLSGIKVDINNFVDAVTILAVVACFAEGETHIQNAAIAKHKECNRLHCIATELSKMGAQIQETDDGLIIRKSNLKGVEVHSYNDHRMAMALTVAGLGATGETIVTSTDCIAKTFSSFTHDFRILGADIIEYH